VILSDEDKAQADALLLTYTEMSIALKTHIAPEVYAKRKAEQQAGRAEWIAKAEAAAGAPQKGESTMSLSDAERRVCETLNLTEEEFVARSIGVSADDYRVAQATKALSPLQLEAARRLGLTPEKYASHVEPDTSA